MKPMRVLRYGTPPCRAYLDRAVRASRPSPQLALLVARILRDVERHGDDALVRLTARFDRVRLDPRRLRLGRREVRTLAARADPLVVSALQQMARRIEAYHRPQRQKGYRLRLADQSVLTERVAPLDSVGLYVPGGAGAYPSSVLMNAIPARIAGVPRIEVVTPPRTLETNPAVAAALVIAGLAGNVIRVGGAQAVAALAYGTRTIRPVAKIVGPGNAYVAEAKRQVRGRVETDADAGPSEVVILADQTADAGFVAVDLLAQAEHGSGEERVVLVTTSEALAHLVVQLVGEGLRSTANPINARRALARHGAVILVPGIEQGLEVTNLLAAEHAEVMVRRADAVARRVIAGAVFVGPHTPVAVGDYGIGPNHVLPTGGTSRRASGLSVRDFERRQSSVRMSRRGLKRVAAGIVAVARSEGFTAHALSVLTRLQSEER